MHMPRKTVEGYRQDKSNYYIQKKTQYLRKHNNKIIVISTISVIKKIEHYNL